MKTTTPVDLERHFFFKLKWQEPDYLDTHTPWYRMVITALDELSIYPRGTEEQTKVVLFLKLAKRLGLRKGDFLTDEDTGKCYRVLSVKHDRGDDKFIVVTQEQEDAGKGYLLQIQR